jgi:protein-tyrosine phosphatase
MRSTARLLKRGLTDLYWDLRGPSIRLSAVPENPRSLLFVCKGNICRSPFAEHLASKLLKETNGVAVGSAGLHVTSPISSPENAIHSAKAYGVNLETHRSRPISLELVKSYDMIIAMEVWQYAALKAQFGSHHEKLFLLPRVACNGSSNEQGYCAYNIADPFGGQSRAFEECFERIGQCLRRLIASIHRQ